MRRIIGMDIHRTFGEVVFWEDGRLRPAGRVDMTRSGLEGLGRHLTKEDEIVIEATGKAPTHPPGRAVRDASFMYSKREYDNALQEMKVGMAVYAQLEDWKQKGVPIDFPVPERSLFTRRSVEYELCSEVARLKFSPVAVAGVMELCNCVLSRADEWNAKLKEVALQSHELGERARCICFQILFRLCALSAGGLRGPILSALREEFKKKFDNIDGALARKGESDVKNRTWWLLAKSVMQDGKAQPLLKRFHERIDNIVHHPLERKLFEKACATLISLWRPEGSEVTDRNDFAVNALNLLREQTERIARSDAISQAAVEQSAVLTNLLAEVLRELKEKGKIETDDTIKKKIAGLAGDAVEHKLLTTSHERPDQRRDSAKGEYDRGMRPQYILSGDGRRCARYFR